MKNTHAPSGFVNPHELHAAGVRIVEIEIIQTRSGSDE